MRVAKFGGTSLATAEQIKKVCSIIVSEPGRRLVVVSAPGKRFRGDIKVTDLLIKLAETSISGGDVDKALEDVLSRFRSITEELNLPSRTYENIENNIRGRLNEDKSDTMKYTDNIKAAGEDNCARMIAGYLSSLGHDASYINPRDAGMLLSKEYGNAVVLPQAYERLAGLKDRKGISIFPGFFGYSEDGDIVTFSRGGSDITGAILAAATDAELYENFTDVDSVFAVNPNIVPDPKPINQLTYREMRELSYAGFSVFHEEALVPVYHKGIPVAIKNTNNPEAPGTTIVPGLDRIDRPIVGIASDEGFCSIYIRKYLMNREIGFGRKVLAILEDEGLSYEHTPSGIDDISIILSQSQLDESREERIISRIRNELDVDDVFIEHDLALIMVVGEGSRHTIGMAARATSAFARAGVNIEMINQGSSEVSMMFGVKAEDNKKAVVCLYEEFFGDRD